MKLRQFGHHEAADFLERKWGDDAEERSVVCERDTDGDGDCALCWNKGGCLQYHKDLAGKSGAGRAALVAPVQAETMLWLAGMWESMAEVSLAYHKQTKNRAGSRDGSWVEKGKAIAYRNAAKDLRHRLSKPESEADTPLEHESLKTDCCGYQSPNNKRS